MEVGSSEALVLLGRCCEGGYCGFKQSTEEALRWYQKSADAGSSTAMSTIGDLYCCGRGVDRDYAQAMR